MSPPKRLVFGEDSLPPPDTKAKRPQGKAKATGQTDVWTPPPLPPPPEKPCGACGSMQWYPRPEFARWDCPVCRPPLGTEKAQVPVGCPGPPSWAPWCARCYPKVPRGKGWKELKCYRCDREVGGLADPIRTGSTTTDLHRLRGISSGDSPQPDHCAEYSRGGTV